MRNLIQRNRIISFFVLTFAWSWGIWSYLLFTTTPGDMTKGISPIFFLFAILGGFGPSLAALVVSRVADGKAGLRALIGGLNPRGVQIKWVLIAISIPLVAVLTPSIVRAAAGQPVDFGDILSRLAIGLVWPLMASLGEELGWRGYVLPRWREKFSWLVTGLLVGLVWGFWHLITDYIGLGSMGGLFLPFFLFAGPIGLTLHSLMMVWIYKKNNNSLFMMVLYHYAITSGSILFSPLNLSAQDSLTNSALSALALGLIFFFVWRGGGFREERVEAH